MSKIFDNKKTIIIIEISQKGKTPNKKKRNVIILRLPPCNGKKEKKHHPVHCTQITIIMRTGLSPKVDRKYYFLTKTYRLYS